MIRRAILSTLITVGVVAATLTAFAAPSVAHLGYMPVSKFGSAGSGAGQLNAPEGVAIDESTGDVYVVDAGNSRVERFEADGKYVSAFDGGETPAREFSRPTYIAVDNSGDAAKGHVYVADPDKNVVDVFDSSGKYLFQISVEAVTAITTDASGHLWAWTNQASFEEYGETGVLITRQPISRGTRPGIVVDSNANVYVLYGTEKIGRYSPPSFPEDNEASVGGAVTLAINPATDNIFQDDGSNIVKWPPAGEGPGLWERFEETITGSLTESRGLAVNGKNGVLYASDTAANDVEMFAEVVTPDATTGPASEVTSGSAMLKGTVNPDKTKTKYFFEWGETASYGHSVSIGEVGEGEAAVPVSTDLSGLQASTVYHYRLVAENENGKSLGEDRMLKTGVVAPVIEDASLAATEITRSSAKLQGIVDPKNNNTTYQFQFGTSVSYGQVTTERSIGAGRGGFQTDQIALGGLLPDTTYHYRLVATNEAGAMVSHDHTFTTSAATPPAAVTGAGSGITQTAVTLSGTVDTNSLPGEYGFELGSQAGVYGAPVIAGGTTGIGVETVALGFSGLLPGVTYHYRIFATNIDGTSYGADQAFTTPGVSNPLIQPTSIPILDAPLASFPVEVKVTHHLTPKKKPKKHKKKTLKRKKKK